LDKIPPDAHPLDIKRDLLSGGFLDRKPPSIFYFPHRSFQEYLVAEELSDMLHGRDRRLTDCPYLTPEATSFFIELVGANNILQLRKRWSEPATPSTTLRDVINTGCAHYELDLLGSVRESASAEDRKQATLQERESLLRKLEIVGVVSTPVEKVHSKKKQLKSKHRKAGVTRKRKYRTE
jgi:hypothetical protein